MVPIERRNAETLLPLIEQYILPNTTIVSDMWKAYNGVDALMPGYEHFTVNHEENFVDPTDHGVHTQSIESSWQKFKQSKKQSYGWPSALFSSYIEDYIWRKEFGGVNDVFYNIWNLISEIYPCQQ